MQASYSLLTSNKELDAPSNFDLVLKRFALLFQVCRVAVQDVGILRHDVDVAEEVVPHEGVVALRMLSGKPLMNFVMV